MDGLVGQLRAAAETCRAETILLAGGVAANGVLRARAAAMAAEIGASFHVPPPALCTDNAAMVACAGVQKFLAFGPDALDLGVSPNLSL